MSKKKEYSPFPFYPTPIEREFLEMKRDAQEHPNKNFQHVIRERVFGKEFRKWLKTREGSKENLGKP